MIDTEPFLDAAIASLRTNLPGKLDALNATASFAVPKPDDDSYFLGVVSRPLKYPIVEVAVPDWTMTGFDVGTLTADAEFPMMVSATLRDAGEAALHSDRLYRSTLRYVRALLNTLLEPNAFGLHATVTAVRGAYRMNPETRESSEVIAAALVAFTIDTTQTREV